MSVHQPSEWKGVGDLDKAKGLRFRYVSFWFLILGLLAGLYLPSLEFDLFADDFGFYGHKELGRSFVGYFFKGERPALSAEESTFFRPLADYVWALKFALFGTRIDYYHAVAVLVHLINTVLVFVFARRVLGLDRLWSQCASFLFAVFWFNFEAVAWLSANDTAICTAFLLSAILFSVRYVRRGGVGALFALSLSMVLAIAAKEFALVMPLVLALIWFMTRPRQVITAGATPGTRPRPPSVTTHAAGWYPDPTGRFDQRWFDGGWTEHVARHGDGRTYTDPMLRP